MTNKILIITGDGGESYETWYAYHRFREAGYDPHIAAPSKRRLHLVMHDFEEGWDTYVERQGYGADADMAFDEVTVDQFVAILIIGGRAPEYLRNSQSVIRIVKEFAEKKKWMFSICHGIQVLVAAGLTHGKQVACYEHLRFEVESTGAKWLPKNAQRDGNLVTAPTWKAHPEFYKEVFNCLNEK